MSKIIDVPLSAVIVLIGASGSGKSTFARRHFCPNEILSSDHFRALVSDDENNQAVTDDAFGVLHHIARKRLKNGRLCVIDATNVRRRDRKKYAELARAFNVPAIAIVLPMDKDLCLARKSTRTDRIIDESAILQQLELLSRDLNTLEQEGFTPVHVLGSLEDLNAAEIRRTTALCGEPFSGTQ